MHVAKIKLDSVSFDEVAALADSDTQAVDRLIRKSLQSDVALVSQVSEYIVMSGGKRLRPLIVLLAARALGYEGEQHVRAAAIIEFIHTATLLHDDVVDSSERRRGRDSANTVFGNEASVLVGDFLYSRSFQMMVDIGDMRVMQILADATNTIAAGEVQQLMNVHDPAMIDYGRQLGTAFQLIDDALDYDASSDELGKNLGDDLAEGKPTLPLIRAMSAGNETQRQLIRDAITAGGRENMREIQAVIQSTGALEYTVQRARAASDEAIAALDAIPESPYGEALKALAEFAVQRRS
jgi:octaprenyl-diphosphate synthase